MQLLAIDAGNTRIKWGVHDGTRFVATGALATGDAATLAIGSHSVSRVIASNVAGADVARHIEAACARLGAEVTFVASAGQQLGVTNRYEVPGQLGSDRWVALVAAHQAGAADQLVVNVGTALTIDMLTAGGEFLGGVIVPGPALMRRSLDRGTAGLRLTEGHYRELPRRTPDAITTGAIHAAAGAIERMARAMGQQGHAPAKVVMSGGAAGEVAPHLPIATAIHENLVLDGLALIARAG